MYILYQGRDNPQPSALRVDAGALTVSTRSIGSLIVITRTSLVHIDNCILVAIHFGIGPR